MLSVHFHFYICRSKGYGFISFIDRSIVNRVINEKNHVIGGKRVVCKIASPKNKSPIISKNVSKNDDETIHCMNMIQYLLSFRLIWICKYIKNVFWLQNEIPQHLRQVYIGNLDIESSISQLKNYFSYFGPILNAYIVSDDNQR